jgi:hypothetical protein
MSLKLVHIAFITISFGLSVFMTLWGIREYRITGDQMSLGIGLFFAALLIPLGLYGRWFWKKCQKLPELAVALGVLAVLLWQQIPAAAWACTVCFKDPNSQMTRGAQSGVIFLTVVVYLVLAGILAIAITWIRRARALSARHHL